MSAHPLLGALTQRFGLVPRPDWPERIAATLSALADERGSSPDEVVSKAEADAVLMRRIAGSLVVEETHFFRDPSALRFVGDHLARLVSFPGRSGHAALWSAGCSTGEEAYTMAMLLEDRLPAPLLDRVTILASDLNATAIAVAEAGTYGAWSFRNVPDSCLDRFFERNGDQLRVRAATRRRVRFNHTSLQEQLATLPGDALDAIVFRNVAIYLEPEACARLYAGFERVLKPGGLLALASTDPRPEGDGFERIEHETTSLYARRPPAPRRGHVQHRLRPPVHPRRLAKAQPGRDLGERGSPERPARGDSRRPSPPSIAEARALGDSGRLEEALAVADLAVTRFPTAKNWHVLRGQLHLSALNLEAALSDFRRAVFLAPDDPLARYWYALALRQSGHKGQLSAALRGLDLSLSALLPDTLLEDGLTTACELLRAVRDLKGALA